PENGRTRDSSAPRMASDAYAVTIDGLVDYEQMAPGGSFARFGPCKEWLMPGEPSNSLGFRPFAPKWRLMTRLLGLPHEGQSIRSESQGSCSSVVHSSSQQSHQVSSVVAVVIVAAPRRCPCRALPSRQPYPIHTG